MATTKATLLGHRSATSFSDLTLSGDLTVNGTTTTLDTAVQNVDKLEIGASSTDYGAKINQASTGNILQLQDNGTDVMVVKDGGNVGIGAASPSSLLTAKSTSSANLTQTNFYSTGGSLDATTTSDYYFLRYWDESTDYRGARLRVKNHGYSDKGGSIQFQTSKDGTANQWNDGLIIDKAGNVGIGTASPGMPLHVSSAENNLMHLQSTDQDALFKLSDNGGHFQINTANNNTSLGVNGRGEMLRFSGTSAIVINEDGLDQDFRIESDGDANAFFFNGANGNIGLGTDNPAAQLQVNGQTIALGGVFIGEFHENAHIDDASGGTSTRTLYIGNSVIQVSSDYRLKENIANTSINGLGKINDLVVKDFTWNDPSDICINNRNARGAWTGLIAQEVIDVLPFVVNAVRDEKTLKPIPDSVDKNGNILPWRVEYEAIVPIVIKAIQELSAKVTALENA